MPTKGFAPFYLLLPVAVVSGYLYLLGYWVSFGINVFAYISFNDILIAALLPLIGLLLLGALYLVIGLELLFGHVPEIVTNDDDKKYTPEEERRHKWAMRGIWATLIVFLPALILLFSDPYHLFYVPGLWLAIGGAYYTRNVRPIVDFIPNRDVRVLVLFLTFLFPIISLISGRIDYHNLRDDRTGYQFVCTSQLKTKATQYTKLKFIGKAGDYFFFYPYRHNEGPLSVRILKHEDFLDFTLYKSSIYRSTGLLEKLLSDDDELVLQRDCK